MLAELIPGLLAPLVSWLLPRSLITVASLIAYRRADIRSRILFLAAEKESGRLYEPVYQLLDVALQGGFNTGAYNRAWHKKTFDDLWSRSSRRYSNKWVYMRCRTLVHSNHKACRPDETGLHPCYAG